MKKILLTAALPLEMMALKNALKKTPQTDFDFEFLIVWAGNISATFELTQYLLKNSDIDFVLNIGICGKKMEANTDMFLAYRSKNLANNREVVHPLYLDFPYVESLASSEKIITDEADLWDEKYVDMESVGIEFPCNRLKIPYAIFKIPFDSVSENSLKVDKSDIITSLENINFWEIFSALQEFFKQNTPKVDFGDINIWKEKFSLTFTEFEMLKKSLNREIAFGKSEDEILKNLENMTKQEVREFIK